MSDKDLHDILEKADFVVAGYAFRHKEDGMISVVNIEAPYHAAILDDEGNVLETNMFEIELAIVVGKYWFNNRNLLKTDKYA